MSSNPKVSAAINDPEFLKLTPVERREALAIIDPNEFGSMGIADQDEAVFILSDRQQPQPKSVNFPASSGTRQDVMGIAAINARREATRIKREYAEKPLQSMKASAGQAASMLAFPVAAAIDDYNGDDTNKEALSQSINDFTAQKRAAAPDSEVGFVGQMIRSVEELAPMILAGPAGMSLLAAEATTGKAVDLLDQGVDGQTAGVLGAVSGGITAAMGVIPLKGANLINSIAKGIGVNVGLGAAGRGVDKAVLTASGYDEQAEAVKVIDKQAMAHEAVMGALFGLHQGMARDKMPEPARIPEGTAREAYAETLDIYDTLKASGYSESELAKVSPELFQAALRRRGERDGQRSVDLVMDQHDIITDTPIARVNTETKPAGKNLDEIQNEVNTMTVAPEVALQPAADMRPVKQEAPVAAPVEQPIPISSEAKPVEQPPAEVPPGAITENKMTATAAEAEIVHLTGVSQSAKTEELSLQRKVANGEIAPKQAKPLIKLAQIRSKAADRAVKLLNDQKQASISIETPDAATGAIPLPETLSRQEQQAANRARLKESAPIVVDPLKRPGPGAQTQASDVRETPPDLIQLRETLDGVETPTSPRFKPLQVGKELSEGIAVFKGTASRAIAGMKGISEAAWSAYRNPPAWTDFKDALGKYTGQRQKTSLHTSDFAKDINKSLPPEAQEGVTNWIEAKGDRDVLQQRMDATDNVNLKKGYEAALNLNEDQVRLAENIRGYFESRLDQAQEAGIIEQGVENYVNHIWGSESTFAHKVSGEVNAGLLRTNPELAKQRVWETFFQGEQAGGVPKDKRIGYLVTAYDQALNEAIGARGFIKALLDGKAEDGRPLAAVSGSGKPVMKGDKTSSYIINPKTRPEDTADYRHIAHPALQKWKWAGSDSDGKPIIIQGDMLVHPEVYRHMNNILGKSAIREYTVAGVKPGKLLLDGMQELKSTLLSLSLFHQVQEGVHAVGHEVNPFKTPKIDLEQPLQRSLVEHGLMVFNHNAMQEFGEGAYSSGLINRLPIVGAVHKKYGEYLFGDYIPRLKMKMAVDAYERNTKRYEGKLSDDQVKELTAKQANAAFGELNYQMMGRNKTMQDVFRLAALAPDFLEARAKFAAQALKPYGTEQAAALIRLSALMTITAQATNFLLNGEAEWKHPFSIKINERYYTLRSVPGDIMHLFHDPRGFSYNRLNPTLARPVIEALTGKNSMGRNRGLVAQIVDWGKAHVPIPLQALQKDDGTVAGAALQSLGIGSAKARTSAEEKARELLIQNHMPTGDRTPEQEDKARLKKKIGEAMRLNPGQLPPEAKQAEQEGKLTRHELMATRKNASRTVLANDVNRLTMDEALKVWDKADDKERVTLKPVMKMKMRRLAQSMPRAELEVLRPKLEKAGLIPRL